jgi:hypothetical protein
MKGFRPDQLEAYALEFCKVIGMSGDGIVVVRSGEHGSLTTQCSQECVATPILRRKGG